MAVLFVIILMIIGIWLAADYANYKTNKAELVGAIFLIGIAAIIIGAWLVFLPVTGKFGQSERSSYMILFFSIILMILGIRLAVDYSDDKTQKAKLVGAIMLIVIALALGSIYLALRAMAEAFGQCFDLGCETAEGVGRIG
jgi:putative Mn2+ efflux pump MntP